MSAERLLLACKKVRTIGPGEWSACCPAHADSSPSLSVRALDDGTTLAHCFAGCSIEEICLAAGLDIGDLFPEKLPQIQQRAPLRRVFDANAVLKELAQEIEIAYIIACDMNAKREIGPGSYDRLALAVERFQQARRLANG